MDDTKVYIQGMLVRTFAWMTAIAVVLTVGAFKPHWYVAAWQWVTALM